VKAAAAGAGVALLCVLWAGCGPGSARPAENVPEKNPSSSPRNIESDARARGEWSESRVVEELKKAGLKPIRRDTIRQPFLTAAGTVYDISGSDLQLFIYPDPAALKNDISRLDTVRVSPPTMMISWIAPPALITNGNLAVIFLTRNDSIRRIVRGAIGRRD